MLILSSGVPTWSPRQERRPQTPCQHSQSASYRQSSEQKAGCSLPHWQQLWSLLHVSPSAAGTGDPATSLCSTGSKKYNAFKEKTYFSDYKKKKKKRESERSMALKKIKEKGGSTSIHKSWTPTALCLLHPWQCSINYTQSKHTHRPLTVLVHIYGSSLKETQTDRLRHTERDGRHLQGSGGGGRVLVSGVEVSQLVTEASKEGALTLSFVQPFQSLAVLGKELPLSQTSWDFIWTASSSLRVAWCYANLCYIQEHICFIQAPGLTHCPV